MHPAPVALTFRSRIDWWLAALIFVPLGVAAWRGSAEVWHSPTPGNWVAAIVVGLALTITVWLYATTAYDVESTALVVRAGPLRERIPIASIRSIERSRTLIASPALSLRRLEIAYGTYDIAVVSPADQAGFIAALVERNPAIVVR